MRHAKLGSIMITRLTIPQEYLVVSARGKEAEFVNTPEAAAILKDHFGREGLCLKMFKPQAMYWGGSYIGACTTVQNVFSWYGLAPRIYGIIDPPNERLMQVVDFADGSGAPRISKAQQVAAKYGFAVKDGDIDKQLAESHRWIGGQIVDFGRFYFADPNTYEKRMRKHVIRYHKKPHTEAIGYHPCPELGVKGVREIGPRIEMMRWDDYEWKGRTVLDLGCNSGAFSREAAKRGAARVIAVDHKFANKNRELFNWLGYWNVDCLEVSLPGDWKQIRKQSGIDKFDIVICLSMVGHAGGYKGWLPELCGDVLFFSGQGAEDRKDYQARLDRDFGEVNWRGYATDNGKHPVWVCRRQHAQGIAVALDEPLRIEAPEQPDEPERSDEPQEEPWPTSSSSD